MSAAPGSDPQAAVKAMLRAEVGVAQAREGIEELDKLRACYGAVSALCSAADDLNAVPPSDLAMLLDYLNYRYEDAVDCVRRALLCVT